MRPFSLEVVLLYALIQVFVNYVVYRLVKTAKIKTRFGFFFALLTIGLTAATTSLGFLGLMLGSGAILVAAISGALVMPIEQKCTCVRGDTA